VLAIKADAFELTKPVDTSPDAGPEPVDVDPPAVLVWAVFAFAAPCPLGMPAAVPEEQVGVEVPEVPTWVGCAPKLLPAAPTPAPQELWLVFWPSAVELVRPAATLAEPLGWLELPTVAEAG
jgi:hypothetical protein